MEVRVKSPSIDCPVADPTFARKVSRGNARMQFSFSDADEFALEMQLVFVMSESNVDWNAVVPGPVRGKAPPL